MDDNLVLHGFESRFQNLAIDSGREGRPWVIGDAAMADDLVATGAIKGEAMLLMHLIPSVDQGRLGIEDESVKIKNQRSGHRAAMEGVVWDASGAPT